VYTICNVITFRANVFLGVSLILEISFKLNIIVNTDQKQYFLV